MATKKDLVEAYSFSRRRLVTAFVSGAPGGREVEPARPGRTIVGGLALAVLLVAGAAIAGVFAPRTPDDWTKEGLVISKEKGATYVILEQSDKPELRPIINITSAQLILGPDLEPTIISQSTIADQRLGGDLGILGAPPTVPETSDLVETGWTACTGTGLGLQVDVARTPQVRDAAGSGFVVRSRTTKRYYVIAQSRDDGGETPRAYRYELPRIEGTTDDQDNLLAALGLPNRDQATNVSDEWLGLFPAGGSLSFRSFGIDGADQPAPDRGTSGIPDNARVGDFLEAGGEALVLTADGPVPLDPFALAVYRNVVLPGGGLPRLLPTDTLPRVRQAEPPYADARWPDSLLDPVLGEQCARLDPSPGEVPGVRIASDPGPAATASGLGPDELDLNVDAGRGAYVLSGDWQTTASRSPFVIDSKGIAYPLVGIDAPTQLGYEGYDAPVVPDSWVELFEEGVPLSRDAALCPPDRRAGSSCG